MRYLLYSYREREGRGGGVRGEREQGGIARQLALPGAGGEEGIAQQRALPVLSRGRGGRGRR